MITLEIFLVFLAVFQPILADNQPGDSEHHIHQKAHHNSHNRRYNHHLLRHHKGLKAREAEPVVCENICDVELLIVSKWLNGTQELHFLYEILPPSIKNAILNKIKPTTTNPLTTTPGNTGPTLNPVSLFNGSLPIDLDKLYNATENWPILSYLARIFAHFLSNAHGLSNLFGMFPQFCNVWKIIVHAMIEHCSNNMEIFFDNLKELFGFNGNSTAGNLFNLTRWEHIFPPAGIVEGIEHAINKFNLTNFGG
ncbi:unnamed protein product [Ceutorhynchus assimilis]|uniref:Uncharacterized protein n=1 Tax=Ceutorhynchus assimilis TaxID=467358 RepID=A0A9N9MH22_9CUCU|nr:unnamed protein product [Ceutorhynchus assimilis]